MDIDNLKDLHADPTFSANYLLLAGMAAPLVYAATVILGGVLTRR